MDPNNPNLNPKQEELVKRLEEIRRKRNLQGNKQESLESTVMLSLEQQGERRNRNKNKQNAHQQNKRNQPTRSTQKSAVGRQGKVV